MAALDPRDDPAGVEAARRVILEVWTVLAEYQQSLVLVGGSVPPLLTGPVPDDAYAGTLDVDVVIDPRTIPDETYRTIARYLRDRGYLQQAQAYQWVRTVVIDGRPIEVELDLLAPATGSTGRRRRHEVIEGERLARKLRGAELVRAGFGIHELQGLLPDGRHRSVSIQAAGAGVLVVLKAMALGGRDKPKDAYDIDYLLAYVPGGAEFVASDLARLGPSPVVGEALDIIRSAFGSEDGSGPEAVASYRRLELGTDEAARAQALAYARVRALLDAVTKEGRGA